MAFLQASGDDKFLFIDRYVGAQDHLKEWVYITVDAYATVTAASYFATITGPLPVKGDIIRVYQVTSRADLSTVQNVYVLYVADWDASIFTLLSNAATVLSSIGAPYTDNVVVRFDGTTGKAIQGSSVTVSDAGAIGAVASLSFVAGGSLDQITGAATDNAIIRHDGITGKKLQGSTVTVSDAGAVGNVGSLDFAAGGSLDQMTGSATDNALVRQDGTTGKKLQAATATLSDGGAFAGVASVTFTGANAITETGQGLMTSGRLGVGVAVGAGQRLRVQSGDTAKDATGTTNYAVRGEANDRASTRLVQTVGIHGKTTVGPNAATGHESYGVLSELEVYRDQQVGDSADTPCAYYASSYKFGTVNIFGLGIAAHDLNFYALSTDVTSLTGAEIALAATGPEDLTANDGAGLRETLRIAFRATDEDAVVISAVPKNTTTVATTVLPHGLVNGNTVYAHGVSGMSQLNNAEWLIANRGGGGTATINAITVAADGTITVGCTAAHGLANDSVVWFSGITWALGNGWLNGKVGVVGNSSGSTFTINALDSKRTIIDGTDFPAYVSGGTVTWYTTVELKNLDNTALDSSLFSGPATGGFLERVAEGLGLHIRPNTSTYARMTYAALIEDTQSGWTNQLAARTAALGIRSKAPVAIKIVSSPGKCLDTTGATPTGNTIHLADDQLVAFDTLGVKTVRYNLSTNRIQFLDAGTPRVSFDMGATPSVRIAGTKVIGAQVAGWSADTGTAKRTANATYTGTAEVGYTQATIQTLMDEVRDLSRTIKSLKDDLISHGLIGA